MKGVLIPLVGKGFAVGLAFALGVLVLAQGRVALAQEMSPFPILYGGRALIDGEPLTEGTRLVARVGDYETWITVEKNGSYRNLLVAPLSRDYYYVPVTFHALGLTAEEHDVFLPADAPILKATGFDLHFSRPVVEVSPQPSPFPTPTPTPTPAPTSTPQAPPVGGGEGNGFFQPRVAIGAGVTLLALAAWFGLRRRWKER